MDLNSLKDQVANLNLYDLKAGVRKVQNAMMNYTEMEAKVREATNNEPWGASSGLMQEIANGTHSYQLLNEIMPMIYKRFTEKTADEWRQIYKGLQLLEYLIKNGSERVIDDARSHISLLRMLRQFHYIDNNGKDQGINIRNRSQELTKLLGDVEQIRNERKKAKANRGKYGGFEGGPSSTGISGFGSNSRTGGFGSDSLSYGGFSGGVFGDGGGFGGNTGSFADPGRRSTRFEEYDEGDDGYSSRRPERTAPAAPPKPAARPKPPTPDLVSFGDEDEPTQPSLVNSPPAHKIATTGPSSGLVELAPQPADDDDFDDFQSASPPAAISSAPPKSHATIIPAPMTASTSFQTQYAAPQPVSASQNTSLTGLAGYTSSPQTPSVTGSIPKPASQPAAIGALSPTMQSNFHKPTGYQAAQPNYFTSVPAPQSQNTQDVGKPTPKSPVTTSKPGAGGDAFGSLWSSASAGAGIKSSTTAQNKGPNLASMAKERASAGIWGTSGSAGSTPGFGGNAAPQQHQQKQQQQSGKSSALDDLLG
ncbi:Epsin-3, clathrin recruitment and traffic between the Golgi and endosome [Myotisia sp. PD_48]|nr:Epsin-3, clathrin recruitment and traffic between the Golgi and endosome [Myotisia sp. PD_48]